MPIDSYILDPGTSRKAKVGIDRRLAVGPADFSSAYNATLGVDDTVVNIVPAQADHRFIITGITLTGNRNISTTTDATVDIYEATSETSGTAEVNILTIPVARSTSINLPGLFLGCGEAVWINGKTSDDDVLVTIFGYYVKLED
jgi:hypothetical protein